MPLRNPRPTLSRHCLCALLLGTSSLLPSVPALAQSVLQQQHEYLIPAQSLASALNSLGLQSGLQITLDSKLADRRQAPAVEGYLSVTQVLDRLLAGSNLQWRYAPPHTLIIEATSGPHANVSLEETLIQEQSSSAFQGETTYDRQHLQRLPINKGHYTSLLRLHPAVQFDDSQLNSRTPGEIDPADISINGAKFWQNQFMLDGVSINNDINPGERSTTANSSLTDIPGNRSQGLALDVDLLENLNVLDSNISAEYGGFNGGVIDAITRAPSKNLKGSLSTSMTRSSWSRYHIDNRTRQSFFNNPANANGLATSQPDFTTRTYRASLEGHLTEDFGLLGSFSRKDSTIYDQRIYSTSFSTNGLGDDEFNDLKRVIDNYYLKAVWQANDRLHLTANLAYAPQKSDYSNINTLDSEFQMESGGLQTGLTALWQGQHALWTHRLSWSEMQQSRTGGTDYYQSWYYSPEKNWGNPLSRAVNASMYGTFGDLEQGQKRLEYQLKANWNPLFLLGTEHRLSFGLGLEHTKAWYERPRDFSFGVASSATGTTTCTDANGVVDDRHCSTSPVTWLPSGWTAGDGQAFTRLNLYKAGKIDIQQKGWSLFAEDSMQWKRLSVRPGVRFEGDDYMDKNTWSPRLSAAYDIDSRGHTRLIAGANRYYGRNIFDYRLRDGRLLLNYSQQRNKTDLIWSEPVRSAYNNTRFSSLDIPYDDELTFGVVQRLGNLEASLKYIRRKGRDQIVRQRLTGPVDDPLVNQSAHYIYTNNGASDSDNVALTLSTLQSLKLAGTATSGQLILSWNDIRTSHNSYQDDLDAEDDRIIRYDGEFIRYSERPAANYNRPWGVRVVSMTEIPRYRLNVSHFLNWRAPYQQVVYNGETVEHQGQQVEVYERERFGSAMTWDTRIAWEQPFGTQQAAFVNLDISNLLDRINVSTSSRSEVVYELGRQFTLEVGYRF